MINTSSNLEIGKLYFERGDTLRALEVLEPIAEVALSSKNYEVYLEATHILYRAYSELQLFDKITENKSLLLELAKEKSVHYASKTHYILGLCSSSEGKYAESLYHCKQALEAGLATNNKNDVCHATLGLAISYYYLGSIVESLKEIYNVQVFMNVVELPQVRLSAHILKGHILRKQGNFDQALEILWQSYEAIKSEKNFYSYLTVLYSLGSVYKEAGRLTEAKVYLQLAQKSTDKQNLIRLNSLIVDALRGLGSNNRVHAADYDLIFNSDSNEVVEREKGRVDFKNQFILIDLLKLFLDKPGSAFNKEALVKLIWKQSYNPAVHDNKIYVTIKRLRHLIEPNIERPKYIFRSKNGYYIHKDIKVKYEESAGREL